jgi:hypothetical protein
MAQELHNHLHPVFSTGRRGSEMVKSKFLIMVGLYVILAILAVFNFNLYHHFSVGWSKTINEAMQGATNENVGTTTIKAPQEFQESLSDCNE